MELFPLGKIPSLSGFFESEPFANPAMEKVASLIPDFAEAKMQDSLAYADDWFAYCLDQAEQRDGLFLKHLLDHIGSCPVIHIGASPRPPEKSPGVSLLADVVQGYLGVSPHLCPERAHAPWQNVGRIVAPNGYQQLALAYVHADPLDVLARVPAGSGYNFVIHKFYSDGVSIEYYAALAREVARLSTKGTIVSGLLPALFNLLIDKECLGDDRFAIVQVAEVPDRSGVYGATLRPYKVCI